MKNKYLHNYFYSDKIEKKIRTKYKRMVNLKCDRYGGRKTHMLKVDKETLLIFISTSENSEIFQIASNTASAKKKNFSHNFEKKIIYKVIARVVRWYLWLYHRCTFF